MSGVMYISITVHTEPLLTDSWFVKDVVLPFMSVGLAYLCSLHHPEMFQFVNVVCRSHSVTPLIHVLWVRDGVVCRSRNVTPAIHVL